MATATTTPKKRSAPKAAKKADEVTTVAEETSPAELEKSTYELVNRGRTKNGEGKQVYWNLHETGVRGQIFTDPDVVMVKVLVVRNPNAVVE